jgi:hypothetical protein
MRTYDRMKLSLEATKALVETKTAPRVTQASIEARIESIRFSLTDDLLTICILRLDNGFMVTGVSAAASPENFDPDIGQRYAYENAFKQLWVLEGYLLREKLHLEKMSAL